MTFHNMRTVHLKMSHIYANNYTIGNILLNILHKAGQYTEKIRAIYGLYYPIENSR